MNPTSHSLPLRQRSLDRHVEVADELHRRGLSLPCSVDISEAQIDRVLGLLHAMTADSRP